MNQSQKMVSVIALFLVTIAWGMTFPLIRRAMGHISPYEFVALRLLVSAVLFSPVLYMRRGDITAGLVKAGFIFGALEAMCYLCQTIGLQTIRSSDSAFITALSVVIAPLLAPLFGLTSPKKSDFIAAAWCCAGIFILTGADFNSMSAGVYWTLGCALFYALSVNYLSRVTAHLTSGAAFVGLQVTLGLPIPLLTWSVMGGSGSWHIVAISALLFCAITTILAYYLQTRFQHRLPISQVMLIYAFEPIFATIFGIWINKEQVTPHIWVGGALVVSSFIFSQWMAGRRERKNVPSVSNLDEK